jgi:hypothetical protein
VVLKILKYSVEIKTTPEKIFNFFLHIEDNYKDWHPEDHICFKWIKGKPLEVGSSGYFEEHIHGKLHKTKVIYTKIILNEEIEFRISNPIWRIFYPKSMLVIEQKEGSCIFTAINYFRLGLISSRSKRVLNQFEAVKKHMREEGENLKEILEKT